MIEQIVAEMHAKVHERLPMLLTLEETKEVLDALDQPYVNPGVQELARVQEGGAVEEAAPAEESIEEPAEEPKTELSGKIPEDFPGHAALDAAGIHTFHQLRKQRDSKEGLIGVAGVGDATAEKIEEALKG